MFKNLDEKKIIHRIILVFRVQPEDGCLVRQSPVRRLRVQKGRVELPRPLDGLRGVVDEKVQVREVLAAGAEEGVHGGQVLQVQVADAQQVLPKVVVRLGLVPESENQNFCIWNRKKSSLVAESSSRNCNNSFSNKQ